MLLYLDSSNNKIVTIKAHANEALNWLKLYLISENLTHKLNPFFDSVNFCQTQFCIWITTEPHKTQFFQLRESLANWNLLVLLIVDLSLSTFSNLLLFFHISTSIVIECTKSAWWNHRSNINWHWNKFHGFCLSFLC